ncbi:MAG: hypothetical protein AAFP15_20235, partial [Bacteroidota bacterium]
MSTNPETEPGRPPVEQTQIKRIEYYEGRNFHPLKTSLFVLTILISLLFDRGPAGLGLGVGAHGLAQALGLL